MFVVFIIAVVCVVGEIVALNLEPELELDLCKNPDSLASPRNLTSCELLNKTKSGQCEYFSCLKTLPISKQVIGFFIISSRWEPDAIICPERPRLPAYVQVLDLTYDRRLNITASIFDDVSDLQFIRSLLVTSRRVVSIADDVLGNLSNLECVNLDDYDEPTGKYSVLGKFLSVQTLKRLFARNIKFTTKSMNNLIIDKQFNLLFLYLSANEFSDDSHTYLTLDAFARLQGLDLSHSSVRDNIEIYSTTLESLDLSSNSLKSLPGLCTDEGVVYMNLPELQRLDVSNNQIKSILMYDFQCTPKLSFLDLRKNKILYLKFHFRIDVIPPIEILHLEYQASDTFCVFSGIIHPRLVWPLRELYLENWNQLRFHGSYSDDNEWSFLKQSRHLQKLFLDGSNLQLIEEQTFVQLFGHLHDLRTLSLPNTKLQFVSAETFSGSVFPNLTELMLGDNAITRIPDGCFDSLTQLVHLDLSGNKITTVSSLTFSPSLHGRLQAFDLSQNPLTCSCDLMWFHNWFLSDHKLFNSTSDDYKCHNFPRKILLSDFIVNEQSCLLSREANSMIIFCCSVLITTFTIFTLLFRYRWHLRLVLYEAFRGRDDVRRRHLEQGNFDHDVFVSYASEDLNWVRRHLMPQLEDHLHLRLCIHDRQFIPGKNIVDNIADCVEKSKKILMVFTKNFLRSQWCQFELAFCLSHVMEHEDALIILCVDDVVSCEMTSTMMAVLRTTTYIQWENQADAVRSFWGRLKLALNEVIPTEENAV